VKNIGQLSLEDLDFMIEKKVLEILGDPDLGLELKREFREELKKRLAEKTHRVSHKEVMKQFGKS